MPRVYLTETERRSAKLSTYVYGQMKIRRMSISTLAKKKGISHQALSQKLLKHSFTFEDFCFFIQEFPPSDKELRSIIE